MHALCVVHYLRELTFVFERFEQLWAKEMKALLLEIKAGVQRAREEGMTSLPQAIKQDFERRYMHLVQTGMAANPPPPKRTGKRGAPKKSDALNLLIRLHQYQDLILRFMQDFDVPFDNDVIAYCTPSAWLACLLKLTFILVMRVFAGRWEQHDPTAISVVHGNAPSSPPIPDRLWRDSIGLSGFSGR